MMEMIDEREITDDAMNARVRHFLLTPDGIREFSGEDAARIAAGLSRLPEYAPQRMRYVQIMLQDSGTSEIRVQASGACVEFDDQGRLCNAMPVEQAGESISGFEFDACVQWALRELGNRASTTFH